MKALFITAAVTMALLRGLGVALSEQVEKVPEALGFWTGHSSFTTETFVTSGSMAITLGAWCHDGVGFVHVAMIDIEGFEVADVVVFNQGVEYVVVDTEPGAYHLQVTVSHFHVYVWELQVVAMDARASSGDGGGGARRPATRGHIAGR